MCIPHTIHIAVTHIIRDFFGEPRRGKRRAHNKGQVADELPPHEDDDPDDSDGSDDSDDFDSGTNAPQKAAGENQTYEEALARNPLVLIRKLVRGIRSSGQRRDAFRDVIREGIQNRSFIDPQNGKAVTSLPEHELLRDVATRWDSTHSMITRAQELRLVCCSSIRTAPSFVTHNTTN